MIVGTWNMQGSSHSQENKWNEGVMNMMVQLNVDVFCLQECGSVPASANLIQNNFGGIAGLALYSWGGTTTRPFGYILFYPADLNGNRCNLAKSAGLFQLILPYFILPRLQCGDLS